MSGLTAEQRTVHGCLETRPNSKTVWLDGLPLNIRAMARQIGLHHSYLWMILTGKREVSVRRYRQIIEVLNSARRFTLQELLDAIEEVKKARKIPKNTVVRRSTKENLTSGMVREEQKNIAEFEQPGRTELLKQQLEEGNKDT